MKLSALHVASLKRMQQYRDTPPTLRERLRLLARYALLLLVLGVLGGYLAIRINLPGAMFLIAGLVVGGVARDFAQQRQFVQWWPLTREITDWGKVEQLLSTANDPPAVISSEPAPKTRPLRAVGIGVVAAAILLGTAIGIERAAAFAYDPTRNNPPDNVIVLSTSWCPHCLALRHHLTERNIHYTDL